MASQALYRRYRSQTFSELVGQEHIVQTLRNALADGRIAHAYLFTGPRGVGKTTVARLLAKAVNCTADMALRPCGACASCLAIADGRAVDVIEMDAASHTSVEDAREIIERVQFRPTSGAYKVYIVDEVHMLSTAAFNALLKTLEEPPGHALFILATTEIHKVPATILSRCQRFTFSRHTVSATSEHLRAIAAEEQIALEPGVPEAIARAATGSMRDALSVLDQLMAYGSGTITLAQVRGLLGATEAQEITALVDSLVSGDLAGALRALGGVAEQGADLRQFARDLVERLRALMLLKAGGSPDLIDAGEDELATLQRQTAAADLGAVLAWVKLFSGLDQQLRTSAYGQLPLELAIVEALAAPAPAVAAPRPAAQPRQAAPTPATTRTPAPSAPHAQSLPPEPAAPARPMPPPEPARQLVAEPPASAYQPSQPPASPASSLPAEPIPPAVPAPTPEPAVPAPSVPAAIPAVAASSAEIALDNAAAAVLEQVESAWDDVLRVIKAQDRTLFVLLTSNDGMRPIDLKENVILFEVKSDWQVRRIEEQKARRLIEGVLSKRLGANFRISCVAEAENRESPNVRREQIRSSRKDPHVKAAINIFDADIIDIEQG